MDSKSLAARSDALADGAWRLRTAAIRPSRRSTAPGVTAVPEANLIHQTQATSHAPWSRPIRDYERRETTIVEGLRYG